MLDLDRKFAELKALTKAMLPVPKWSIVGAVYGERLDDLHERMIKWSQPVIAEANREPDRVIPTMDAALLGEFIELNNEITELVRDIEVDEEME